MTTTTTRTVELPLELLDRQSAPIHQRAVFARNIAGFGRVETTLKIAAWVALGSPTQIPFTWAAPPREDAEAAK
jgi:hypothetical protein